MVLHEASNRVAAAQDTDEVIVNEATTARIDWHLDKVIRGRRIGSRRRYREHFRVSCRNCRAYAYPLGSVTLLAVLASFTYGAYRMGLRRED